MDAVLHAGLSNAVAAAALGLIAFGVTKVWRNPYVGRCLWCVVLLRLLMPPLWEVPVFRYRQEVAESNRTAVRVSVSARQSMPERRMLSGSDPVVQTESEPFNPPVPPVAYAGEFVEAVPGPQAQRNQPSPPALLPTLRTLWLLSAVCAAAVILVRVLQFRRLLRHAAAAPPHVQEVAAQVAARLGISKLPRLRIMNATVPPLVWSAGGGATVLLPVRLIKRLAPEELEAVLAHELAHVRRRDGAARWLELAAICTFWWHPVTWLARHKLQQAEEECCDADVLRAFPELRRGYAQALLDTLEFLSSGRTLLVPATGLTRRTFLIRRFEMIVKKCPRSRPAHATRALILSAAVVALAAFPVASPAESDGEQIASQPERIACMITLKDGTQIEGYIVRLADDRVVIQRTQPDGPSVVPPRLDDPTEIQVDTHAQLPETREIALSECVAIALKNSSVMRQLEIESLDGKHVLVQDSSNPMRVLSVRGSLENLIRDIETSYWQLWRHHRELESARAGRDEAHEIWRSVYAAHKDNSEHTPATREAQCRAQYFAYRSLVETALSDLLRGENRLSYLMGAARDKRLLSPSHQPQVDEVTFESDEAQLDALANRTELLKARLELLDRTAELEVVKRHVGPDDNHAIFRHHHLLITRERALLRDTELEVSHQVADALRVVDRNYQVTQARLKAMTAAQEEFRDVRMEYELGEVLLDFVLDALRRKTDAERNYYQAIADYAIAVARVHERKGTLLERHGIAIVQEIAGEPKAEEGELD